MPILWRYLLGQYLRVLVLSVIAFIGILLVTRLHEIAQFAVLGGAARFVFLFTFHQIPYILPIAIPISCLISTMILFQNLSSSHELTAFRASGLAMRQVIAPIVIASTFLAIFNFYIISELATSSHLATRKLETEVRSVNPLLLLQNHRLLRSQGAFVDVMGGSRTSDYAEDVVFGMFNKNSKRLNLILAKSLTASDAVIDGQHTSLLASSGGKDEVDFDHLMIENHQAISSPISEFSQLMKKQGWRLSNDHLQMPLLLVRTMNEMQKLQQARALDTASKEKIAYLQGEVNECLSEISRRFSIAIAVFTFTLMGIAFGATIGRYHSQRGLIIVIALAALYLSCFFVAKGLDENFSLATTLYLSPHLIIVALSVRALRRLSRGVE